MLWLSKLFTGALGSGFTLPLVFLIGLIGWHQRSQERDLRIQTAAVNVCDGKWKAEVRRQERDAATAEVTAARNLLGAERMNNERLNDELAKIQLENQSLRALSVAGDAKCLSDGVLRSLEGGPSRPAGGSPKTR
jgi:hypothetical protein